MVGEGVVDLWLTFGCLLPRLSFTGKKWPRGTGFSGGESTTGRELFSMSKRCVLVVATGGIIECVVQEVAAVHWAQRLLWLAFTRWVGRAEGRASARGQLKLAAEHSALTLERCVWSAWRMVWFGRGPWSL